eukprot:Sspe_Gene.91664::Locus_63242_Transcript_1_1_Confidence_1.000_Length_3038::g.91664::m.91664
MPKYQSGYLSVRKQSVAGGGFKGEPVQECGLPTVNQRLWKRVLLATTISGQRKEETDEGEGEAPSASPRGRGPGFGVIKFTGNLVTKTKTTRYNQVRDDVYAAVERGEVLTTVEKRRGVSKKSQGNLDMYTTENLSKRDKLRRSSAINDAISEWWTKLPKKKNCIDGYVYRTLFEPLYKRLVPGSSDSDARKAVEEDWRHEAKGKKLLTEEQFFAGLFALADTWCDNIDEDEYTDFLSELYQIVLSPSSMPYYLLKKYERELKKASHAAPRSYIFEVARPQSVTRTLEDLYDGGVFASGLSKEELQMKQEAFRAERSQKREKGKGRSEGKPREVLGISNAELDAEEAMVVTRDDVPGGEKSADLSRSSSPLLTPEVSNNYSVLPGLVRTTQSRESNRSKLTPWGKQREAMHGAKGEGHAKGGGHKKRGWTWKPCNEDVHHCITSAVAGETLCASQHTTLHTGREQVLRLRRTGALRQKNLSPFTASHMPWPSKALRRRLEFVGRPKDRLCGTVATTACTDKSLTSLLRESWSDDVEHMLGTTDAVALSTSPDVSLLKCIEQLGEGGGELVVPSGGQTGEGGHHGEPVHRLVQHARNQQFVGEDGVPLVVRWAEAMRRHGYTPEEWCAEYGVPPEHFAMWIERAVQLIDRHTIPADTPEVILALQASDRVVKQFLGSVGALSPTANNEADHRQQMGPPQRTRVTRRRSTHRHDALVTYMNRPTLDMRRMWRVKATREKMSPDTFCRRYHVDQSAFRSWLHSSSPECQPARVLEAVYEYVCLDPDLTHRWKQKAADEGVGAGEFAMQNGLNPGRFFEWLANGFTGDAKVVEAVWRFVLGEDPGMRERPRWKGWGDDGERGVYLPPKATRRKGEGPTHAEQVSADTARAGITDSTTSASYRVEQAISDVLSKSLDDTDVPCVTSFATLYSTHPVLTQHRASLVKALGGANPLLLRCGAQSAPPCGMHQGLSPPLSPLSGPSRLP